MPTVPLNRIGAAAATVESDLDSGDRQDARVRIAAYEGSTGAARRVPRTVSWPGRAENRPADARHRAADHVFARAAGLIVHPCE